MKIYDLIPTDGRKSFYGKAAAGELIRMWDGWSATTGRHIAAFCGMGKAEYIKLPVMG